MTTTAASLVDRVRDTLDEFGAAQTTLGAAITTTDGTTCTLSSPVGIAKDDYLSVDYETMFVTSMSSGPAYTCTVRRGQRGSTAATHLNGVMVIVNALYPGNRILNALNSALGKCTKVVKDIATLTYAENTNAYTIPTTIDTLKRVEIEDSNEAGQFTTIRDWEMLDGTMFRLFGTYDTTRNIGCVGTSKYTALATTGNLDASFPDDNQNAINYLCYETAGQLLLQRQGKIAGRDSFVGMTDSFGANYPDHSVRVARQYLAEAERYRILAVRQEPILQTPVAPTQNPSRQYLARY